MIYFVMAQREESKEWDHFGPWDDVEIADAKIVELEEEKDRNHSFYSRIELARVLTDEESTEWLRDPPSRPRNVGYPTHWPEHYSDSSKPCDMIEGPCVCGDWHCIDEDWVKELVDKYGLSEE